MSSWTYKEEARWDDGGDTLSDAQAARADAIAKRLNELDQFEEREGWSRQQAWEDGDGPCSWGCDEEPECLGGTCKWVTAAAQDQRAKQAERDVERDWLLHQLDEMGLRRMRPYEHWNEDERYMEMAESGDYPGLAYR